MTPGRGPIAAAIAVALCAAAGGAAAQPGRLGPREATAPTVEVLTFGVGAEIFEKFGHAAVCLRYRDPRSAPVCFNYGVTSFHDGPILIWRFLRQIQQFWVEPSAWGEPWAPGQGRPRGIIGFYTWEDRDIYRQRLPLTEAEARAVEDRIWDSLREERRYYTYDHFRDNCATRIRDLIDDATGGRLRAGADAAFPLTYRELGWRGLAGLPALRALSDFVMGRQLDEIPTVWEAMFHPEVLRRQLARAFGAPAELLYQRRGPPFPEDGPSGRLPMLLLGLGCALPLLASRAARRLVRGAAARYGLPGWATALAGGAALALGGVCLWLGEVTGAAAVSGLGVVIVLGAIAASPRAALGLATAHLAAWGSLVWALAALSPIPGVRWNEVALVLVPFDLALPFLGDVRRRRYAQLRVAGLCAVSALRGVGVLVQPLWVPILVAFVPLAAIAAGRPGAPAPERPAVPGDATVAG